MAGTYTLMKMFPNIGSRCSLSCKYLITNNNTVNLPLIYQARYAGHSKWQNIAHTKGANDMARGKLFSRLALQIKTAIKEGPGGASVVANSKLANAIEKAKKCNMPSATIQRVLDRALATDKNGKEYVHEFRSGLTGVSLKVVGFTDNIKRLKGGLLGAVKKYGYDETKGGCFFNERGFVVASGGDKEVTLDQAEEYAIEAGAEEVEIVEGNDIKFDCAGEDMQDVVKGLRDQGLNITVSEITHIPVNFVSLDEQGLKMYDKMLGKIMEVDGVDEVISNVENL